MVAEDLRTLVWMEKQNGSITSELTDRISSFGPLNGLCERAKSKAVLSPDTEVVILPVDQV